MPLVLVPPLGVTTETFDLMPQRSMVRFMAANGFKTYLVDWGKPKKEHAHLNLKDYSYTMLGTALEKIRAHSGSQDLSLMGWCMGGLLCLLHQGQVQDPAIRNIITVASPIDLESGRGVIAGRGGRGAGPQRRGPAGEQLHQSADEGAGPGAPGIAALGHHPGFQDDRPGRQRHHLLGPGHPTV